MFSAPIRCGSCNFAKRINQGVFALNNNGNIGQMLNTGAGRSFSDGKSGKDIPETTGKQAEPAWRPDCPSDHPPNYDPYKIKVPDILVPPLPPGNAKEIPCEDSQEQFDGNFRMNTNRDLLFNTSVMHPNFFKNGQLMKSSEHKKEPPVKLGFHGKTKYKYAFYQPWNPLDRLTLLQQAEKEEMVEQHDSSTKDKTRN